METTPALPPNAVVSPSRRHRKWWLLAFVILVLAVLTPVASIGYFNWSVNKEWKLVEAETHALDPRWRLHEIEEDRIKIPDAQNSAPRIAAIAGKIRGKKLFGLPSFGQIFKDLPPTAQLNSQQVIHLTREFAKVGNSRENARLLKDLPLGYTPIIQPQNGYLALVPQCDHVRNVSFMLEWDAYLLAQDNKLDEAVHSCHAMINSGRSLHDEPFFDSFICRTNTQSRALIALERVLAQGSASERMLKAFQTILEQESKDSDCVPATRGERAGIHHFFENIRDGKVCFGDLVGATPTNLDDWMLDNFPTRELQDYPELLRYLNRLVEAAKLPIYDRHDKIKELSTERLDPDSRLCKARPMVRVMAPLMCKVHEADCRSQAMLRSAIIAIACERYRLRHPRQVWPTTLDDLMKAGLLDGIRTDPMDNQPLRYRRTKDGIVVYSIGLDMSDDQGKIDRDRSSNDKGIDIGFRLWDAAMRRQPPLPAVVIPEGE